MRISHVTSSDNEISAVAPVASDADRPWEEQRIKISAGGHAIFLTRPDAQELASALFQAASTTI